MLKNYLAFLATGLLCSLPAYADFSGNGNVWVDCYASPLCPTSGQVTDSFSSLTTTAPNTQSGSAYASDVWGDYMSLSVSGQQTTTSSPTSFSIKWVMTGSMSGFGIGGGGAVLGTGGTFGFVDLPTAGLLHITATMQGDMGSGGYGFASDAHGIFRVLSPGKIIPQLIGRTMKRYPSGQAHIMVTMRSAALFAVPPLTSSTTPTTLMYRRLLPSPPTLRPFPSPDGSPRSHSRCSYCRSFAARPSTAAFPS